MIDEWLKWYDSLLSRVAITEHSSVKKNKINETTTIANNNVMVIIIGDRERTGEWREKEKKREYVVILARSSRYPAISRSRRRASLISEHKRKAWENSRENSGRTSTYPQLYANMFFLQRH